jgi:hypothetical protein
MWHLFQLLIMFIVGGTNIVYEWTDNGYLVGLAGMVAAYCATVVLYVLLGLPGMLRSFIRRCLGTDTDPYCYPSRHVDSLPRSTWRMGEAAKNLGRSRIGDDPGQLGEIVAGLPLSPHLMRRVPPFARGSRGLGEIGD